MFYFKKKNKTKQKVWKQKKIINKMKTNPNVVECVLHSVLKIQFSFNVIPF
jgi:hypothetical protein